MEEREKLPNRKLIGRKQDGEKVEEWEKLPNRKLIGSKRVGEKIEEREKLPNRKLIGSKRVGEKIEERENSQPEAFEKQAGWEKVAKRENSPINEARCRVVT